MDPAQEFGLAHRLLEHVVGAAIGTNGKEEAGEERMVLLLQIFDHFNAVAHGLLTLLGVPGRLGGAIGLRIVATLHVKVGQPGPSAHTLRRLCKGVGFTGVLPALGEAGGNVGKGGAARLEKGGYAKVGAGAVLIISKDEGLIRVHHKGLGFGISGVAAGVHAQDLEVQVGNGVKVYKARRDEHSRGVDDLVRGRAIGVSLKPNKGDAVVFRDDYAVFQHMVSILVPGDNPASLYGDSSHCFLPLSRFFGTANYQASRGGPTSLRAIIYPKGLSKQRMWKGWPVIQEW